VSCQEQLRVCELGIRSRGTGATVTPRPDCALDPHHTGLRLRGDWSGELAWRAVVVTASEQRSFESVTFCLFEGPARGGASEVPQEPSELYSSPASGQVDSMSSGVHLPSIRASFAMVGRRAP
jgi:hypothetical protein